MDRTKALVARQKKKTYIICFALLIATVLFAMAGTLIGPATLSLADFQSLLTGETQLLTDLIWKIRFPRVILALITGGALAVSGCALQNLFNNPLADTGLIGISSGAVMGVVTGVLFGKAIPVFGSILESHPQYFLPLLAFTGAFGLGLLVYRLALQGGKVNIGIMLLAGIAANAFAGAYTGLLINLANDEQLRTITFWSLGSLNGAEPSTNIILGCFVLVGTLMLLRRSGELDVMTMGEREAVYLGVDTGKIKKEVLLITALMCGPITAYVGLIGFVGLVIPHILRMVIGPKMKPLMIASFLSGGIFLNLSDTFAKTVVAPSELPIGVITALIGTPFFTYLLLKQKRRISL